MTDERHSPWLADYEFESLEDALSQLAGSCEVERAYWWEVGDICESALQQFGRTAEVKGALATQLGCGRRMVELHAQVAATFAPEHRYPDRPVELFKELVKWEDPVGGLGLALEGNWSAADARRVRMEQDGQSEGAVLFRRQEATLYVHRFQEEPPVTHYAVSWQEPGSPVVAQEMQDVWATVSERVGDA
jgi:hypothetical protein